MHKIGSWMIWVCLALLSLAYFFQLPTPLRVNTDGVTYLSLAASFNDGHGFIWHNHKAHFPSGYPAIVAALESGGFGTSMGLVGWNLFCMAISIIAGIWLLQRWLGLSGDIAGLVVVVWLLSWGTVKYASIPGSEMSYLAVSFICLVLLWHAETTEGNLAWAYWLAAIMLVPIAMSIRLVGVVLPPAIAWSFLLMLWRRRAEPKEPLRPWMAQRQKAIKIFAVIALLAICALGWAVSRTSYFKEGVSVMTSNGIFSELIFTIKQRCLEAISLLTNIRTNRGSAVRALLAIGGALCLGLILLLVAWRWRQLRSLDVCVACYLGILMVWPYREDVRFWLPIQIFVYGLIARELTTLLPKLPVCIVSAVWLTLFALLGVSALIRSTKLTYSGKQFSEQLVEYPFFRDTYRAALHNGLPVDPDKVNPELMPLLQRFGSRDFGH